MAGGANSSVVHQPAGGRAAGRSRTRWSTRPHGPDLLIQAQALIAEDSPVISVTNPGWPLAVNKRVQGADIGALWYWASLFKDLWVTE